MTTIFAAAPRMTAPTRTSRLTWKMVIRRAFELAGAPYADGAYQPI